MRKFDYFQLALALVGLLIFLTLAFGVFTHASYITWIDNLGTTYIRHPVTAERTWFFKNITRAGNTHWTMFVMVVAGLIALAIRKFDVAFFLGLNVGVFGLGTMLILKHTFVRQRPSLYHIVEEAGYSFPSGHALNAVLLYGSLIVLAHYYVTNDQARYAFITLLSGIIVAIPISRVYLGVHYLSDVMAGFALGTFFLIMSKEFIFKYRTREVFENAEHARFSATSD
jgi:undecaprenyl-diphosphatase